MSGGELSSSPGKSSRGVTGVARLAQVFDSLRARGRKGLAPFVTAGYPDLETTFALVPRLEAAGASVVEIGFPYSDPIADGPVIASSMHEALGAGFSCEALFEGMAGIRGKTGMALVAMASISIAQRMGVKRFVERCATAGFDGVLFPDLPLGESEEARQAAAGAKLACIHLIAPTTPRERAAEIAKACTGFVYVLLRTGTTGARADVPAAAAAERVKELRGATGLPIACGFGLSSAAGVEAVTRHADAAIVGSAIVKVLGGMRTAPISRRVEETARFVSELAKGLANGRAQC